MAARRRRKKKAKSKTMTVHHREDGSAFVNIAVEEKPRPPALSGISAMQEALMVGELRELKARGVDVDAFLDGTTYVVTNLWELVNTLASLSSGGGCCINCGCDDCLKKLSDDIAHEMGLKDVIDALREAVHEP